MSVDTVCGIFLGVSLTLIAEALFIVWLVRKEKELDMYGD